MHRRFSPFQGTYLPWASFQAMPGSLRDPHPQVLGGLLLSIFMAHYFFKVYYKIQFYKDKIFKLKKKHNHLIHIDDQLNGGSVEAFTGFLCLFTHSELNSLVVINRTFTASLPLHLVGKSEQYTGFGNPDK